MRAPSALLLTVAFLWCSFSSQAQAEYGGVVLRSAYQLSNFNDFQLNEFFTSFNDYYGSNMEEPFLRYDERTLDMFNGGVGFRLGFGEKIGPSLGLLTTFGQKTVQRNARFQNQIVTQTDLRMRDWTVQFDAGLHFFGVLFVQGHIAGHFRRSVFTLGYVYQDGSYSLGNEYDILGVYKAPTTTIDVGGSLGLRLGPVFIPVSISYPTGFISDDGLLTLTDFEKRQARWSDLPRDFRQWVEDPANLDPDTQLVEARGFESVRINIGIEIWLGKNNKL
jgi:hypothetical protein